MSQRIFDYTVKGTGDGGQTWEVTDVIVQQPHRFHSMFADVMNNVFQRLTDGKAVYGKPGEGCQGPYRVDEFTLKVRSETVDAAA